jgi:hypothetical protein
MHKFIYPASELSSEEIRIMEELSEIAAYSKFSAGDSI